MMRDLHHPAMSVQEAAMLPAGHFTMTLNESHFVPICKEQTPLRRGSPAGRAVLRADGVNMPGVWPMRCNRRKT